jgi:prepilin-type N-terminal cleavage/methylation domain-containing protein
MMEGQRGFSLVEVLVAVGVVAMSLLALLAVRGTRPPQAHVAALGLQSALAEARVLAASNARADGSGATVSLVPDGHGGTTVSVYDARPIAGDAPPVADAGFPPKHYHAAMRLTGGAATLSPLSIFVSSSGYASVAAGYGYDPAHPLLLSADPGCNEAAGVAIAVSDGAASETHPLDCRDTQYDVQTNLPGGSGG